MLKLLHHPLSPASRTVRLFLAEKGLAFTAVVEKPWEARPEFLALSPGGDVPVFIDEEGLAYTDAGTICDYIEEIHPEPVLIGKTAKMRASVRQLARFYERVFGRDVVDALVVEKAMKRIQGTGVPEATTIRRGYAVLEEHLKYLNWLAEQNKWLAGDALSLADLAAAAHFSVIDYLGDVPWERYPEAKGWYVRLKSRPSFRPLLADHIPGLPPPPHYANLDF